MIGKHFQPGKWTKICSLHFEPKDFYNFWSSYRSLKEDAVPSIFPFETVTATKTASKGRTTRVSRGELGHQTAVSAGNEGCHSSHSTSVVENTIIEAGSTHQQEQGSVCNCRQVIQLEKEASEARKEIIQLRRQLEEAKDEIAKSTPNEVGPEAREKPEVAKLKVN